MSEKNSVQVLIGGKVFTLSGFESEEYLEKVASFLNRKLEELKTLAGWRRMTSDSKGILLSLNVADDYYKARSKAEELEEELKHKDQELYELKQELVDLQVQLEGYKKNPSGNRSGSYNQHGNYRK